MEITTMTCDTTVTIEVDLDSVISQAELDDVLSAIDDDGAVIEAVAQRMTGVEFALEILDYVELDELLARAMKRKGQELQFVLQEIGYVARTEQPQPIATYYVVNVAHNGRHLFATAEHSLTTKEEARRMYDDLRSKYPEADGYKVTCSGWAKVGHDVDFSKEGE